MVVGTIYLQIALDGIQSMMKICKSVITAAGKDTQQMQIIDGCKLSTQLLEIMQVCQDSFTKSSRLYMKSSAYIKLGATEIAHRENMLIKRALKFNELEGLDKDMSHYDMGMIQMHRTIRQSLELPISTVATIDTGDSLSCSTQSSLSRLPTRLVEESMSVDTPPTTDPSSTIVSPPIAQTATVLPLIPNIIDVTTENTLPIHITPVLHPRPSPPPTLTIRQSTQHTNNHTYNRNPNHSYNCGLFTTACYKRSQWFFLPKPVHKDNQYTPAESMSVIIQFADNKLRYIHGMTSLKDCGAKFCKKRVSENIIITLMIQNKYVPVGSSTMYALLSQWKLKGKLSFSVWRHGNKPGPKPIIKKASIDSLVEKYCEQNQGGRSSSRVNLEESITDKLKQDWLDFDGYRHRKDTVPATSMNRIVNRVMALEEFNIFNSVSNKTESRAAAEFSVRSTVSYMLVVVTTHFINAKPSIFHSKHKELTKSPLYLLLDQLNRKALGVKLCTASIQHLTYVLPNLITSTDEYSLFISSQKIMNKIAWYFSTRPTLTNTPNIDSNRRDHYTTDLHGDAHLRGIRITLNNTFTAGGKCAPIFACVFGMKSTEMPRDEIIVCRIKGLVAASNMNGSMQEGFVVFIRGKYENAQDRDASESSTTQSGASESSTTQSDTSDETNVTLVGQSKEVRVAQIYREEVYYPFLKQIRTNDYQMDEKGPIPDNLTAVSWMDGCHGQLKLITTEKVLETEKNKKIISNKHSAARTAVEQAADVGPMFKLMKGVIKKMPSSCSETSPVFHRLTNLFQDLEKTSDKGNGRVVLLPTHKKNAIIVGLSKLPIAMASAFTLDIIQSAFCDNGMLDQVNEVMPCLKNLVGTYRGGIDKDHYLRNPERIVKKFYKETYLNGRVEESSFDKEKLDMDRDSLGNIITRDFGISKENCQRAKVLSCDTQRKARQTLKKEIKIKEYEKLVALYEDEVKRYNLNEECESKVVTSYYKIRSMNTTASDSNETTIKTYAELTSKFTIEHFGCHKHKGLYKFKPHSKHLKAFLNVRQVIKEQKASGPVYDSLHNIKVDELISKCFAERLKPSIRKRQFTLHPVLIE